MRFQSSFGEVELTEERKGHIFRFHPEVRKYQKYFAKTLAVPDSIGRSRFDTAVLIFYRLLQSKKYLAIVIKTNRRNFILTAYLTDKIQRQAP